ncbi:hypothetical protein PGTDC60_0287 [Porphyromonas gingivalis TDC60]|nr:hypothetical protein PGTDC60_0287 [Porphyromonas gingivalis TDC60]
MNNYYFNCTIQELKLNNPLKSYMILEDFNCTIQELKLQYEIMSYIYCRYFNCTIQELKQRIVSPYVVLSLGFQLHHTGIKTSERGIVSTLRSHFNCTIQELKQLRTYTTVNPETISIAPYRN